MVWKCRMIEYTREVCPSKALPGDMFWGPTEAECDADEALPRHHQQDLWWPYSYCEGRYLSNYYQLNNSHRRPLLIFLPGRVLFCLDSIAYSTGVYGNGWKVTGEAPLITVDPTIHIRETWRGSIVNGVISDDLDGRLYTADNEVIRT